jgi:hypothetical protein
MKTQSHDVTHYLEIIRENDSTLCNKQKKNNPGPVTNCQMTPTYYVSVILKTLRQTRHSLQIARCP